MLNKIPGATHYLVLVDRSGKPLGCGMAALSGSAIGIFGIATHMDHRGLGFGVALIRSLLRWGKENGGRYAFLQVESANSPALALYRKLGFAELYSYWYRVKELH